MTLYNNKKLVASSLCEKVSGELNQHDMHECVNISPPPPPLPIPQLVSSQSNPPQNLPDFKSIDAAVAIPMICVCWWFGAVFVP